MSALPHLMQPDWNDVHHFTVLVERETLTAAAEALNVQHSTVSRRIERLEQTLGLRLFDRIGKRYLLTPEGERLYRHACEICKDMSMLQRTAREQAELRHSVVISAPPFVARLLLMPHIADFYRKHADIRLHLLAEAALADLHGRQADIALRLIHSEAALADLHGRQANIALPCASSAPPKTTLPCAASPISPTASTAMKAT